MAKHQAAFSTDRDTLYENLDRAHPDRYVLSSNDPDAKGFVTTFVHIPDRNAKKGRVFVAIGRTARYQLDKLLSTKHFVPVARPYVIRRDDGHEISYG